MHFAMRVARGVGAIAKIAQGKLASVPKGAGQTASGATIPPLVVTPADLLDGWSIGDKERPKRGLTKANVVDRKAGARVQVQAGDASNGPDYVFPQIFGSQTEAMHAVSARSAHFKRNEAHFHGSFRPGLAPPPAGGVLTSQDFGDDDDHDWTIKSLDTHFGDQKGVRVSFRAEVKAANPPASVAPAAKSGSTSSGNTQEAGAVTQGSNVG